MTSHPADLSSSTGGCLCLDYANAWFGEDVGPRSYGDLLHWAVGADLMTEADRLRLEEVAALRPHEAEATRARADRLRSALRAVLSSVAAGRDPDAADLDLVNQELSAALPRLRLEPGASCCRWRWSTPLDALDRILWEVVRSAADLLTSPQLRRLRECAADSCSWLFLDTSRNQRRKWCDMATCGNRAKARRYYRRHREEPTPGG